MVQKYGAVGRETEQQMKLTQGIALLCLIVWYLRAGFLGQPISEGPR